MAIIIAILGLIDLLLIIFIGYKLNRNPAPVNWKIVCYAALVFLLGAIPFYGEYTILKVMHNTS